jgi:hypothetical protein
MQIATPGLLRTNWLLIGKHIKSAARNRPLERSTGVHEETPNAVTSDELGGIFDSAWARSSPTHELSAHGRSVQQRLDAPAPQPARPSVWKRLRFAIYRMRSGR